MRMEVQRSEWKEVSLFALFLIKNNLYSLRYNIYIIFFFFILGINYRGINERVWSYFEHVYGGGPVCVRSKKFI